MWKFLQVSKHMNHLLKAPFCVHPKTGRVCVPIDPQKCETFDPTTVPTLSQLLNELNENEAKHSSINNGSKTRDLEKTSLGRAVHFFQTSFLDPLLQSSKAEVAAAYQEKLHESASRPTLNW
jgi:DNA primase small subunit